MNRFKTSKFKNTTPKIAKKDVSNERCKKASPALVFSNGEEDGMEFWGTSENVWRKLNFLHICRRLLHRKSVLVEKQ